MWYKRRSDAPIDDQWGLDDLSRRWSWYSVACSFRWSRPSDCGVIRGAWSGSGINSASHRSGKDCPKARRRRRSLRKTARRRGVQKESCDNVTTFSHVHSTSWQVGAVDRNQIHCETPTSSVSTGYRYGQYNPSCLETI